MWKKRRLSETKETLETQEEQEDISEAIDTEPVANNSNQLTFNLGHKFWVRKHSEKRLIIVLERANLESIKTKRGYELINCDEHLRLLRKYKKDPAQCRPDILHQCLLMLQDSPLNQSGLLQLFIHTEKNVLIQVHPQCRIPRTFKRFAGLMVQLLHRFSVRAAQSNIKLLKIIKNPVSDHLPVGCRKIATSFSAQKRVTPRQFAANINEPLALFVGAMAHGKVEVDYTDEEISISKFHLSAALTCSKICTAFEESWAVE